MRTEQNITHVKMKLMNRSLPLICIDVDDIERKNLLFSAYASLIVATMYVHICMS